MRLKTIGYGAILIGVIAAFTLAGCAKSGEAKPVKPKPAEATSTTMPETTKANGAPSTVAGLKMANNIVCPITGSKVGSMMKDAHVDYGGYRVGLCCPDCESKFMKDPDTNLKKVLTPK